MGAAMETGLHPSHLGLAELDAARDQPTIAVLHDQADLIRLLGAGPLSVGANAGGDQQPDQRQTAHPLLMIYHTHLTWITRSQHRDAKSFPGPSLRLATFATLR
jgi:hypothetical protein